MQHLYSPNPQIVLFLMIGFAQKLMNNKYPKAKNMRSIPSLNPIASFNMPITNEKRAPPAMAEQIFPVKLPFPSTHKTVKKTNNQSMRQRTEAPTNFLPLVLPTRLSALYRERYQASRLPLSVALQK